MSIEKRDAAIPSTAYATAAIVGILRPQHWSKNLLIFVPLVTSHQLGNRGKLVDAITAFICFSLCASAAYILNDIIDLDADRQHPEKSNRAFAAGFISTRLAPLLIGLCVVIAGAVSMWLLPGLFTVSLAAYLATTVAYSLWLKSIALLDVIVLASLYTVRILAGGLAGDVVVSEWLMAFAVFFFTSLAFTKRYAELSRLATEGVADAAGRGYRVGDQSLLAIMGVSSGFVAVLVFALYINSDSVDVLYERQWVLWLICPVLLFWISRIWLKAQRSELSEDPVVFAIRDPVSLAAVVVVTILIFTAAVGRN